MSFLLRPAVVALLLVVAATAGCAPGSQTVTITIHHSGFDVTEATALRGVPITFILINEDPIDHEWLIGDDAFHEAHRSGTHEAHDEIPTEVTVPALSSRRTTITFAEAGQLAYICHVPGHEAFGMVGVLTVSG